MKVLLIGLLFICNATFSQTPFFGRLAKPVYSSPRFSHNAAVAITRPDSIFLGWRPTATAAYGYSSAGGNTVMAFAGIAYEHDTYHFSSETWKTDWAASLQLGTGASNGSVSLANATTVAIFGSFFNKLLTIGFGYNFSNKNGIPLIGPGIAFH